MNLVNFDGGGKVFCNLEMKHFILALDAVTGAFCWEFLPPSHQFS